MECGTNATTERTLKKLIEAGFIYARGVSDEPADEDENIPDWWKERLRGTVCIINDECWTAFELFQMCGTQWRVSPMGHRTGLDYTAVIALADVMGCKDQDTINYIRYLELGAIMAYMDKNIEAVLNG
jgi:hypothetical protein